MDGREAILWGLVVAVVSPTLSPALNNIAPTPTYPPPPSPFSAPFLLFSTSHRSPCPGEPLTALMYTRVQVHSYTHTYTHRRAHSTHVHTCTSTLMYTHINTRALTTLISTQHLYTHSYTHRRALQQSCGCGSGRSWKHLREFFTCTVYTK